MAGETPQTLETIRRWKQIELSPGQRLGFAEAAWGLKPNPSIRPSHLLIPRRLDDDRPDLWHTLNRVQENLIKGDLRSRNASGRRIRTRPIRSVDGDIRINRGLWSLAEGLDR
ncbi:DUF932 domain-containing protein [Tautonia rosea]|uniref:DUF932 domain-containing protein n=1 Tax=Tautonia rosea TaxID=2728037 RepID=UPI0036F3CD29